MKCKFCNGVAAVIFKRDIVYYSCSACSSIFSYPVIGLEEFYRLYEPAYWFERQRAIDHPTIIERIDHDYAIAVSRIDRIEELGVVSGSLLDVGCSNGAFVKRALQCSFDAYGIEVCADIAAIARENVREGARILVSTIESFELRGFDVVVLNDVIEHVRYPCAVLAKVCKMTKRLLVVEAPDPESEECKEQGVNWRHLRYKEHLNLPSREALTSEVQKYGFTLRCYDRPIPAKMALYFILED